MNYSWQHPAILATGPALTVDKQLKKFIVSIGHIFVMMLSFSKMGYSSPKSFIALSYCFNKPGARSTAHPL